MLENGNQAIDTVKEGKSKLMAMFMKVNLKTMHVTAQARILNTMEINIKVNGKTIQSTALAHKLNPMEINMLENGKKAKGTV